MTEQANHAPFRIGGYYRERSGELVRLDAVVSPPPDLTRYFEDTVPVLISKQAHDGSFFESGWRRLSDGRYQYEMSNATSRFHLVPGECDEKGNPLDAAATEAVADECAQPETIRPALTWADSKAIDPFAGYEASRSTNPFEDDNALDQRHFLQRSPDLDKQGHQVHPAFGSAWLR